MSVQAPERPAVAFDAVGLAPADPRRTDPRRAPGRRPHLRPVEPPRRRRSPAVPALVGVGLVIAALLALAAMHALLIGGQVRLDGLRSDVASEHEQIRRLQLRVAELESPDRVLDAARERLGMVEPDEVGYLLPDGIETGSDEPVRVAAAEEPPPPEPPAVDPTTSETGSSDGPRPETATSGAVDEGASSDGGLGE